MFLTNPSLEKHQNKVIEIVKESFNENKDLLKNNKLLQSLSTDNENSLVNLLLIPYVNKSVQREDYKVFSICTVEWENKKQRIGIGIFGMVLIAPQFKDNLNLVFNQLDNKTIAE